MDLIYKFICVATLVGLVPAFGAGFDRRKPTGCDRLVGGARPRALHAKEMFIIGMEEPDAPMSQTFLLDWQHRRGENDWSAYLHRLAHLLAKIQPESSMQKNLERIDFLSEDLRFQILHHVNTHCTFNVPDLVGVVHACTAHVEQRFDFADIKFVVTSHWLVDYRQNQISPFSWATHSIELDTPALQPLSPTGKNNIRIDVERTKATGSPELLKNFESGLAPLQ